LTKLDRLRWSLAFAIFLFGLATASLANLKWGILTIVLFSPPLVLQIPRSRTLRAAGIWWGVFLVLQSIISPWVTRNQASTLPPNFSRVFDVVSGLPGISGIQTVTTDEQGFRITKTIDYSKADSFRIFAVGGSTTEQLYLDDHRTWTHLLQELLDSKSNESVEVVNTGVSGTRVRHHLPTLKKIAQFNPDIVLFLVGINDWNHQIRMDNLNVGRRVIAELFAPVRLRKTLLGRSIHTLRYRRKMAKTDEEESGTGIELETGEILSDRRGSIKRKFVVEYDAGSVDKSYADYLMKISVICKDGAFDCVFISQPTGYSRDAEDGFVSGFWMTPPHQDYTLTLESLEKTANMYNRYLREFADKEGHHFCDLANDFEPSYEFFYDDCHFNEKGAQRAAASLDLCLSNWLNWPQSP
jgi:lysophospholipase L1-like esterase